MKRIWSVLVVILAFSTMLSLAKEGVPSPKDSKLVARRFRAFVGYQLCLESSKHFPGVITFLPINGNFDETETNAGVQNFSWLPDGRYIAFDFAPDHDMANWQKKSKIWLVDTLTLETKPLIDKAYLPSWGSEGLNFVSLQSGEPVGQVIKDPVALFKNKKSPAFNLDATTLYKFVNYYNNNDTNGLESVFAPSKAKELKKRLKGSIAPSRLSQKLSIGGRLKFEPSCKKEADACYFLIFSDFFSEDPMVVRMEYIVVSLKNHKVIGIAPPTF